MSDRSERGGRAPGRRPAEGVRILRDEEAQAALDSGEAAGRRPQEELRFGDRPPAPRGPRPAHRFPLPGAGDSDEVPLPQPAPRPPRPPRAWDEPPSGQAAGPSWDPGERTTELGVPPPPRPPAAPRGPEGITVTGGAEMPHWTAPPTGEIPRILADDGYGTEVGDDDLEAWNALGSRGTRWRDTGEDWEDAGEMADLAGDEQPVGVLDQTRSEHSDIYSFDEDFERVASTRSGPRHLARGDDPRSPSRARSATRGRGAAQPGSGRGRGAPGDPGELPGPERRRPQHRVPEEPGDGEMGSRVAVGVVLVVLLGIAYSIGPKALVVLAAAVIVVTLAEAYGMLQRGGFRPATLLGLVAAAGVVFGAYWRGVEALPLAAALVFGGSMMWYVLRIVDARPLVNVAVTVMAFLWVAVLGSYASLLLAARHGRGLFLGAILVAVVTDIAAFMVGRWVGSRPMAERISPSKTVEGFLGGLVAALIAGAIVGKDLAPWGGMRHGLVLGLVVGLVAPLGDLFESMVKRDLRIKDSGNVLGGHGGMLDRFDSVLLALPAAFYVASLFGLVR